jgi:hypothetical protein
LQRFILKVEGPNLEDSEEVELPQLPVVGEPIETRYGTCLIVETQSFDDDSAFAGQIICRLP